MNLRQRKGRREEVTIELTPLIDVVFLLLIFFLLTSAISQAQNSNTSRDSLIPIDLPEAQSGSSSMAVDPLTLSITDTGEIEIDGGPQDLEGETLEERLTSLYRIDPNAQILLRGDEGAKYGSVIELWGAIKEIGFKRVDVVITTPSEEGPP